MTARTSLIASLSLWLIFSVARQVFDLIGKLWIPVFFNLLQILSNISGLFAVLQSRIYLLVFLILFSLLSLFYNTFILLWYNNQFENIEETLLSAGLPYSHSFFIRFTPLCSSHFNLTSSKWVQSDCILPYYRIESIQCLFHSFLALIVIILSAIVLRISWNSKKVRSTKKYPTVTIEFPSRSRSSEMKSNNSPFGANFGQGRNLKTSVDQPISGYIQQSRRTSRSNQKKRGNLKDFSVLSTNCSSLFEKGVTKIGNKNENETSNTSISRSNSLKSFNAIAERQQHATLTEKLNEISTFHNRQAVLRGSGTNLMSLISFDPKSNTLIRVQKHVEEDTDEDLCEDSIPEQVLVQNLASVDRGFPYQRSCSHSLSHISVPSCHGFNNNSVSSTHNYRNNIMDKNTRHLLTQLSGRHKAPSSFPVINNNSLLV